MKWFDFWTKNCHTRCEECGAPIQKWVDQEVFAAQAHILPKALFPSVADELENHMTLGATCGCHARFDRSWSSAQAMKIFEEAHERVQTFLHKIVDPEERRKIPDVFLNPLNTSTDD